MATIRNPIEWTGAQLAQTAHGLASAYRSLHHIQETIHSPAPAVRRISVADVWDALAKGYGDLAAYRSDVIFLCVVYAAAGLVLARLAFGASMLPLIFPLMSGFAIVGPFAAVGLYEMSRLREQGVKAAWGNAFDVVRSPTAGAILVLGLLLIAIFLLWLLAAWIVYRYTLGPEQPASVMSFIHDVFLTDPGRTMIVVGVGMGAVFAFLAMAISIVSFPLLIDRDIGLDTAIETSIRAVVANPLSMLVWGMIVTAGLVLGSLPFFVGLVVVLPVLGHATWHLYRKLIPR